MKANLIFVDLHLSHDLIMIDIISQL